MTEYTVRRGGDLGRAIAQLRADRKLSQADLGALGGLSSAYVSKIESGRTVSLLEHQLRVLRRLGATVTVQWEAEVDSADA